MNAGKSTLTRRNFPQSARVAPGGLALTPALSTQAEDAATVELAALRDACRFKTDYPEIARRAERYFA
jgi:hypothetical protein